VADDLERQEVADALVASHVELLEVEARQFVLAAQWADLHPAEAVGSGTVLPGTEGAKRYGGEGTPWAGEFAAAELGVLLGRSHVAAATLMADALDVRHRLPRLWAALLAGSVRVWQGRGAGSPTSSRRGSSPPTPRPRTPAGWRRSWTGSSSPASPPSTA
jgi:hypothetical protein